MHIYEIDKKIEILQKLKAILGLEPKNFIEEIFLKYIELGKTVLVANYVNELGYRVPTEAGSRKYISTDITDILEDTQSKEIVREEIYNLTINMKKSKKLLDRFLLDIGSD